MKQVPAAKAVVCNAAGEAGEVLYTVGGSPGYFEFEIQANPLFDFKIFACLIDLSLERIGTHL